MIAARDTRRPVLSCPALFRLGLALLAFALLGVPLSARADTLVHYPAVTPDVESQASPLVIHGALDPALAAPLLEGFQARYPAIELTYRNLTTLEIYQAFLASPTTPEADVILSSAMPWQYQLANQGHAAALASETARAWPAWARWRHELFGFTFEPIVIVYRRELLERYGPIDSHQVLLDLLMRERDALRDKVVTYDPVESGVGYTYAIEDAQVSPRYWDLVAALGGVDAELLGTTGAMLEGLASGRYLIGYNLLGSYASRYAEQHPELVVEVPNDYALVTQRLALIPRHARHLEAAQRFLDYLLGLPGQRIIAERTPLGAVHPQLSAADSAQALSERLGDALRPIRIGPGLLATLDNLKRESLLERWQREFTRFTRPDDAAPLASPSPNPSRPQPHHPSAKDTP
ncbi:ABC transporter substrate-binding protein [Halomonas sp. WWR20]